VCRSFPCLHSRLRANGLIGAQIWVCAVRRRTPQGMDVRTCRLQRCGGESMRHRLVCVPSFPVAPSVRCRVGGCPLFLWPLLQPIPIVQQAERTWGVLNARPGQSPPLLFSSWNHGRGKQTDRQERRCRYCRGEWQCAAECAQLCHRTDPAAKGQSSHSIAANGSTRAIIAAPLPAIGTRRFPHSRASFCSCVVLCCGSDVSRPS
jgi:hypothetical protein